MTLPVPSPEVTDLAARGRKIEAIKRYREESGAGLAAAKAAIEALPVVPRPSLPREDSDLDSTPASRRAAAFLAATLLGFFGTVGAGLELIQALEASRWPEVPGQIVTARVVAAPESPDRLDLEYTFEVDGQIHRGHRIGFAVVQGPWFTAALAERYPAGAAVPVRYDPSDPSRCVLETRVSFAYWCVFGLALGALLWGATRWREQAVRERRAA